MKKIWDDEQLGAYISKSNSYSELCDLLGISSNNKNVRNKLHLFDTSHWSRKISRPRKHKFDLSEILVENSSYTNTTVLKARLLKENILRSECYDCGITMWKGKPISLQLDHINGINNDNRIENIRILCPNCHSQTETFCGKNTSKERKKAKGVIRYSCSHCERLTHNSKIVTCHECSIKYRIGAYARKFTLEQEQEIKNKYINNSVSLNKLAKEYKVSRDTITKIVREEHIVPV